MFEARKVLSIDDFDYDRLWDESYEAIEIGYVFDRTLTRNMRKATFRQWMEVNLSDPNCNAVVASKDGVDVAYLGGFCDGGVVWINLALYGRFEGSKAYWRSKEFAEVWKSAVIDGMPATKVGTVLRKGSPIIKSQCENYGIRKLEPYGENEVRGLLGD